MWEERGIANVESLEVAVQLAGFPIAAPTYLPDGFVRTNIRIIRQGAGLPEEMRPKFPSTEVEQSFIWQEDDSAMFFLIQTQHKFSLGGSEPYEMNGKTAERAYEEGNPQRQNPNPMLSFAWEIDGNYFSITGFLFSPLDEATLEKIANSVALP